MAQLNMGTLKPDYLNQMAKEQVSYGQNKAIANRKMAMARHPSVSGSPRSQEFHASAQYHLGAAQSNVQRVRAMKPEPAETMHGNFMRSRNPSEN